MARRIDEDTILQLLLSDSDENSSESEKEDHIEVDPAYESVSEDEVSSLTQYPPPGPDVQVETYRSELAANDVLRSYYAPDPSSLPRSYSTPLHGGSAP
ncbi:hypothetical protein EVAR_81935_1 [Eumeta japonica]|uniref:Uncharacterized protein n=1 Tax=Eumeta variegata TaxID=151549 RepID=A0A4C1ZJD3_EUMVA|nr:hypothetical protein EVAR_81935_1 [Eumeta japonica]